MTLADNFTFTQSLMNFAAGDAFSAKVSGDIRTAPQLFEVLYRELNLPGYFGFNWNALFDCLRDFHWVDEQRVVIIHEELPDLVFSEMKIYLEVLRDAVLDWKPGESHLLQVVFDERDRSKIERIMAGEEC
ncbi:barstar family protein [Burkholderia pyrrocinia]|uniref:barstar family protein n=1 Tax=Burkholderia pyrrocinia TaxID=60550 RepID=UPI0030D1602A